MKILIVSDTHRQNGNLCKVLAMVGDYIDMLIHLGDAEGSEDYIREIAGCPVEIIAGNNDFFSRLPREREFMLGNYKVFLTHGHAYNVSFTTPQPTSSAVSTESSSICAQSAASASSRDFPSARPARIISCTFKNRCSSAARVFAKSAFPW